MSNDDWYRNKTWNSDIESTFLAKLKRARTQKLHYLRIQASYLSKPHPDISLKLLELYFEAAIKENHFDIASAYLTQAESLLQLEKSNAAIKAFKNSIQREKEFPNAKTEAWKFYSVYAVRKKRIDLYDEILDLLNSLKTLLFVDDKFICTAIKAIILFELGEKKNAVQFAKQAFDQTQIKNSSFKHHKNLGLYSDKYKDIYLEISKIINTEAH